MGENSGKVNKKGRECLVYEIPLMKEGLDFH